VLGLIGKKNLSIGKKILFNWQKKLMYFDWQKKPLNWQKDLIQLAKKTTPVLNYM
jgi:hypothetical protein